MPRGLNDDEWRNVFELAHAAAEVPKGNRLAFIESHSSSPDIAREVIALIAEFDLPADPGHATGSEIGHFVLGNRIGSGGMGDVYIAQDTELARTVAVKLLNPHSLAMGDAQERFIREARTASALNHPNIVTVHEIIRSGSRLAIIMEFVDGKSLRLYTAEPHPAAKVISYGHQMADALAAAHAAGIVHRDIKPENVMLRSDGRIKVLDFGLARSLSGLNDSAVSTPGLPAGTWRYMSPEHFKGLPLTGSSDVFALGLVLWELLTGRYPFLEGSPFEILQSIASHEVEPPSNWNPGIPSELDSLVGAMLAKDPAQRPSAQFVSETLRDLDVSLRVPRKGSTIDASSRRFWVWASVGLLFVAAGFAWKYFRGGERWRFEQVTTFVPENRSTAAAISADGNLVAYANDDGVFTRNSQTGDSTPLRSPQGFVVDHLAWFGDGEEIVTSGFSASTHEPAIWILSTDGGPARQLRTQATQPEPSPDGREIAFLSSDLSSIWVMPKEGGEGRRVLTAATGDTFVTSVWMTGGKYLICQRRHYSGTRDLGFVMLDRYYERSLESVDLRNGSIVGRIPDLWIDSAASLPDGRVIFLRLTKPGDYFSNQLWQVRVDPNSGRFHGGLEKVADPLKGEEGRLSQMSASSDGRQVAVVRSHGQNAVFVADLHTNPIRFAKTRRLTLDEKSSYPHAWTGDSRSVIFESDRNGSWDLFKQRVDQRVPELIVGAPARAEVLPQLSPDGLFVLYAESPKGKMTDYRAMKVPLNGGAPEEIPVGGRLEEFRCALKPATRCVVRTTIDRNYYVYSELDPSSGIGRELSRTAWMPSVTADWGISPDGRFIALPNHDWQSAKIRIIDLEAKRLERRGRELDLAGLTNLSGLTWAADGSGWFVSVITTVGRRLLFVDLDGHRSPLGDIQGWVVPSPDGKMVAFLNNIAATNAWIVKLE